MMKLLHILLGVRPAPWAEGGAPRVEWFAAPSNERLLAMLVLIAATAWALWRLYRREGRELSTKVRLLLSTLRLIALAAVLAMLLEPVLVFVKKEWEPSTLLVLLDRSESMDLTDPYGDAAQAKRITTVAGLSGVDAASKTPRGEIARAILDGPVGEALKAEGDRRVELVEFAGGLLRGGAATQPGESPPERSATAVGTALRAAVSARRGRPLAGVLLITDAQSNAGEPPARAAEFLAAEGVPLVALAAGTPQGPRNARITRLDVSPVIFVRDNATATVVLESKGMADTPAAVVLERRREGGAWEEVARQPVTLGETGRIQTVNFDFSEEAPTRLELRATITDAGPELTTADNVALADVRAINQRIRTLFVAGSAFPEVQFLRNSLLRDKTVDSSTFLQSADPNYAHPGTSPIRRLPATRAELDAYDCVILYDPDPSLFPADFSQMLCDFVSQSGGGLVYVAGERMTRLSFERANEPGFSFVGLLPVLVEPGLFRSEVSVRLSSREAWRLEVTPEGKSDAIFRFADETNANDRVLASLPGMYWHFPVTRAKPAATVLARHGDPRMRNQYGPEVLLATQLVGPGRAFFLGFDSTYRWRFLSEQYFDGFWARIVDRAGRGKQLGGRYPFALTADRASYRPGDAVRVQARFINPGDATADLLRGEVETADAGAEPITLTPRPDDHAVFEATFTPRKPGPHAVRVWSGEADLAIATTQPATPRAATLRVDVELPNAEYERPGVDRATLDNLARITHGQVFAFDQADQLPGAFKVRRVAHTLEDRQPLWHAPLLFATVIVALTAEWVLRKKFRLV